MPVVLDCEEIGGTSVVSLAFSSRVSERSTGTADSTSALSIATFSCSVASGCSFGSGIDCCWSSPSSGAESACWSFWALSSSALLRWALLELDEPGSRNMVSNMRSKTFNDRRWSGRVLRGMATRDQAAEKLKNIEFSCNLGVQIWWIWRGNIQKTEPAGYGSKTTSVALVMIRATQMWLRVVCGFDVMDKRYRIGP